MSIIKRTRNTDIECGVKGALVHCWWECELVQSLSIIENSIGFLKYLFMCKSEALKAVGWGRSSTICMYGLGIEIIRE